MEWFPDYNYILASKSPRRQQLLQSLGIPFTVKTHEVEENYPERTYQRRNSCVSGKTKSRTV